jgi:hypothetical protein
LWCIDTYNAVLSGQGIAASQKAVANLYKKLDEELFLSGIQLVYQDFGNSTEFNDNIAEFNRITKLCIVNHRTYTVQNGSILLTLTEEFRPMSLRNISFAGMVVQMGVWYPCGVRIDTSGNVFLLAVIGGTFDASWIHISFFADLIL